ncbi:MAG: transcriptional regulator, partial [Mesorhizobium sp.]
RLSDIVAQYRSDADPRSVAANCAFVERHQRPKKSSSTKQA